jgi:RND superfamily putative drug exporter
MTQLASLAYRHPRRVLGVAGVLFIVAVLVGGPIVNLLQASLSDFEDPGSPTARATRLIQHASGAQDVVGLVALVKTGANVETSVPARQQEEQVDALLRHQRGFVGSYDYASTNDSELVSRDGRESLVLATFASRKLAFRAAEHARAKLRSGGVAFGGLDVVFEELTHRSRTDLERAELYAFPLLLLLTLWVFRGLVAALLPLLVGAFTILGTFLGLRLVEEFLGLSVFALNLVSALGLGLAIDYSLFVVSRFREELRRAGDLRAAIGETFATAGRTVLYSSLTVAAAMASLCVFPLPFLYSMGIAGVLTALFAGVVSLIVLPALLVLLGDRVNALSPAWLQRSRTRGAPDSRGFWWRLAQAVMRRPGMIALASGGLLLALGSPVLQLGLTPASSSLLPTSSQARYVDEAIKRNFANSPALPIAAVIKQPLSGGGPVFAYAQEAAQVSGEATAVRPLYLEHSTWAVTVPPRGDPFGTANERLVRRLRALRTPFPVAVGGITGWYMDQLSSISSHLPLALVIIALTMFATIFAMTGSAVLPIKTFVMNLLTLSATTGVLVLAFQDDGLGGLFDFRGNGGLEPSNLVLLFTVAFALASDYGVFLLARIKEGHDAGLANRAAIALGMQRTGRLITAAALLFCVATGALVSSSILSVKELGFGAAIAVAIDASIVRALLVPSLMALLGKWNWWAPAWLSRLHARIGIREVGVGAHSARGAEPVGSGAIGQGPH